MVPDSRAPAGPDRLRALNLPRPVTVRTRPPGDAPALLVEAGRARRVARVQDAWRIEEEWWREPVRRRYFQVLLEDGALRTLFHDLVADAWYEQAP